MASDFHLFYSSKAPSSRPATPTLWTIPAMTAPNKPALLWDIFCRVIDNFGDIGVCWRLCADLAARGHHVRLWVDDASALTWMAPGALEGNWHGIEVHDWAQTAHRESLPNLAPADVWMECFGCDIAPEFIAAHASASGAAPEKDLQNPVWINLEYLSAESYVERSHGLPSPILSGPARGRTRHFFYPGFTQGAGGLLREPDLAQRQARFDRHAWPNDWGIEPKPGERLISLFCYEPAALPWLLRHLASQNLPTRLLVTAGRAQAAVQALIKDENRLNPPWNKREVLSISYLPALTQREFDHLLWACDLNFVRGEDSLVRALWAGQPFIWNIYPQDDDAHHAKLDAFLNMLGADTSLRHLHRQWNGLEGTDCSTISLPEPLDAWRRIATEARTRLLKMDDLVTQLIHFVSKKR
jgi:uncharacterized repeat protein (TIGR03837 family)